MPEIDHAQGGGNARRLLSDAEVFGSTGATTTRLLTDADVGLAAERGPAANPAPRARTWSEAAADTGAQLAEGVNVIAGALPDLVAPESRAARFFRDGAEFWRDKQSDPLKARIATADQAIDAAGRDGVLSQVAEAASRYFDDPALAARFVTTNLPSMIPGLGAAKLAQAAAIARGATAMRAAQVATTAGGLANAALNAGGARGESFEDIRRTLEAQGLSPEEAERRAIADSRVVAAVGGLAGFISGKTGLEGAMFGKATGKSAMKAGTAALAAEIGGEQLEEVAPKVATNVQAGAYDGRPLGQDVGRTIVETAIGSGPGAFVAGGAAAHRARNGSQAMPSAVPESGLGQPSGDGGEAQAPSPPGKRSGRRTHGDARIAELEIESASRALSPAEDVELAKLRAGTAPESGQPVAASVVDQAPAHSDRLLSDSDVGIAESAQQAGTNELAGDSQDASAPSPLQRGADFWTFALAQGVSPAEIRVGSPEWSELRDRYADFRSGWRGSEQRPQAPLAQPGDINPFTGSPEAAGGDPGEPAQSHAAADRRPSATATPLAPENVFSDITPAQPKQTLDQAQPSMPTAQGIDPSIQNRDRGRASSVRQMQEIARNPDYGRLGTSRSPADGAPMVFAVNDDVRIPAERAGRADVAVMADGQRVPFRYAIVDASQVEASHFADGQVNPRHAARVHGDLIALNNGRTAGLRAAYEQGTADAYRQELAADAAAHGIPSEAVARTRNPILVRIYSDSANTADMAAKSQGQALGMSPGELARQDAPLVDGHVLAVYTPGDIGSAGNRDFVRAFIGKLHQAGQDIAPMMASDGSLSPAGRQRIQAAVMQSAYGDADLVEGLFDSLEPEIKAIGEALKSVAGEWASMREASALGAINPESDITGNVVQAVNLVRKARRERTSLYDLVNQPDLMTGEAPDVLTIGALRLFYSGDYFTRASSRDSVIAGMRGYIQAAMSTTAGADLFGQTVTPGNILDSITNKGAINAGTNPQEGRGEPDGRRAAGNDAAAPGGDRQGQREADARGQARTDRAGERTHAAGAARQAGEEVAQGDEAASLTRKTAAAPEPRIEDVGASLYANRRNFTGRGITWSDVEGLNDTLRRKEVTKARVWPRPDYEKLISEGMPALLARMVKHVYDGIGAGPTIRAGSPDDADLRRYIDTLTKVREGLLSFVNDREAVRDFATSMLSSIRADRALAGPIDLGDLARQTLSAQDLSRMLLARIWPEEVRPGSTLRAFARGTTANAEIGVIGGNRALAAMQFGRDDFKKWAADLGKGWPAKREAWQVQGYRVLTPGEYRVDGPKTRSAFNRETQRMEPTGETYFSLRRSDGEGRTWSLSERPADGAHVLVDESGSLAEAFPTSEAAIEAARSRVKRGPAAGQDIRGTNIENAERVGPARRAEGENITDQALMDTFGFRGVNFGREGWIKQAERQAYLNEAHDGLLDLAEVLGVSPKALSLNGELGIAFGAQGSGGNAAAHFVPGVNEINLTRTKGAGTLAHEWGHALDHYFAVQAGMAKEDSPFLSSHANKADTRDRMEPQGGKLVRASSPTFSAEVRPEIVAQFRRIREAMTRRSESAGEAKMRLDAATSDARRGLDRWLAATRARIENSTATNKADLLAEFDQHAQALRDGDTGDGYAQSGQAAFSARVAAVRNAIKDATGRVLPLDETRGLDAKARYLRSLIGKQHADTAHEPQKVTTQFAADSASLDAAKGGKPYWSTSPEMFARAFELYVHDRMSQGGNRNTFLTDAGIRAGQPHQVEDRSSAMARAAGTKRDLFVYPVGKERETLREAFDALVGEFKTRDTDRGVAIFASSVRSVPLPVSQRVSEATVADEIEKRIGGFAHQPPVLIRERAQGVVPGARDGDAVSGAVHDGRIYLFRDQLASRRDVQETLFHELFHYGVRRFMTQGEFTAEMGRLYDRDAWIRARADDWTATDEGAAATRYGGEEYARARGVEETLARLAEPNAGVYMRTDVLGRVYVTVTRWLADLAERLGFTEYAAKLRGIKNEEARKVIAEIFGKVESDAAPAFDTWTHSADPAFSRNTIGDKEQPAIGPQQATRWSAAKARVMRLTDPRVIDKLIYELQDKFIDLKRLRDHIGEIGGTITDLNDAYLGEELFHKRLAKRTEDFLGKELRPLLAQMRTSAVSLAELEQYLHARHAPEANRVLAERNPNRSTIDKGKADAAATLRDLELQLQRARANDSATKAIEDAIEKATAEAQRWSGAQAFRGTEDDRRALSGMSDEQAKAYIDGLEPGKRKRLEALAGLVDGMQSKTLDLLETYGLMDAETLNAWRTTYAHYVPLHRDEARPDSDRHPIGQGFSVKGQAARRRVGSGEKVTNILGHIAMQREAALTRGEKNHVVKKLYLLAAQNPDRDFWSLDEPPQVKTIDSAIGFVRTGVDPAYKHLPNVVMVRLGGKDKSVVFNEHNPQAVRLAEAMKNLDVGDLHVVLGLVAKGTRWFASVNTQYNPIFGLVNFARDLQAGLLNLSTTDLRGQEKAVAAGIPAAMRAIYRERRGKAAANDWTRLWGEMLDVGGTTGYRDLFADVDERVRALTRELEALDRGEVSKAAHAVVDWLSHYNETMENAVRLAAYKVAIDQKMTRERAASLAKNLTVNFNRKGRQAREIGALYAFFNASIQGTARMAETLRGPLGRRIMYGGVLLGAVNALIGMAVMGGGDGDEPDNWEKIPDFIKERSLVIPLGRADYLTIPLPLGFHVLPNIGRVAVEFAVGEPDKSVGRRIGELMMILVDAFNPVGGAQNLGQMAAPTVLDPVVALMQNRDWTGRPIYRENVDRLDPQPGHRMAKDSASTPSRLVAEAVNRITGGTDFRPGAWSPTPDQLDYVIGQLTGGLGRELLKANQTVSSMVTGDELPPHKVPLVGRVYGNTRGPSGQSARYFENVQAINELENEVKGRARTGRGYLEVLDSEPLARLAPLARGSQAQIRALRDTRRRIVERADEGYQERAREIDQRIGDVMGRLNDEVTKARRTAVAATR